MAAYYYCDYSLNLASQTCAVACVHPERRRSGTQGGSAQTGQRLNRNTRRSADSVLVVAHKMEQTIGLSRSAPTR